MYIDVNESMFRDYFKLYEREHHFSYEGLGALYDYLIEYEESCDHKIELDVIALCCEYSEEPIKDVLENYNLESIDELKDHTQVIWHDEENVLYASY
jgi:hypothetical protein